MVGDERPAPPHRRRPRPVAKTSLKVLGVVALVVVLFGGAYVGVKALAGMVNDALGGDDGSGRRTGRGGDPAGLARCPDRPAAGGGRGDSLRPPFERAVRLQQVSEPAAGRHLRAGDRHDRGRRHRRPGRGPGRGAAHHPDRGADRRRDAGSLAEQTGLDVAALEGALLDGSVTSDLLPAAPEALADWEGLLFPDTYEIFENDPPAKVLQLLADTAEERVASIDWSYLTARGLTPYDGVIIASLIEREAALDEERPLIASVVFNRLEIDMALQIDATIVYLLGGLPEGGLSLDDLQIESPYNTYLNKGLPPTPISGTRLASLRAAAAPAETDYLYYVLSDADGHHAFTADFDEFLLLQQEARQAGLIP